MGAALTKGLIRVEMTFHPNLELVPIVRRFVSDVTQRADVHAEDVDRIAMATHELVENAVRFSQDGTACLLIDVTPGDPSSVTIRTTNRASAENCAIVVDQLDQMRAISDPFTFYLTAMRETARRAQGSGLGLARVFAEGSLDLDCSIEGDIIKVTARGSLLGNEE